MRAIPRSISVVQRRSSSAACCLPAGHHSHICTSHRFVSHPGGGRGDLFKRNASSYSQQYGGAARGIVHLSESTEPQDGQPHVRKRREHISFDRRYSGGVSAPAAIATWSYLVPSLRANVEAACPDALFARLQADGGVLSEEEAQQLMEGRRLFRYELQQRIGLLEDSLAEAELPYLLQWPTLFQRLWLRLPLGKEASRPAQADGTSTPSSAVSVVQADALVAPLTTTAAWAAASSSPSALIPLAKTAAAAGAHHANTSFSTRLDRLTAHVVDCVEQELAAVDAAEGTSGGAAPKSRRQVALVASWRAQWQAAVQWHTK